MARPDIARRLREPAALAGETLLHRDDLSFLDPAPDGPARVRAAGRPDAPGAGPRFSEADHALDAAVAGAGVVPGRSALAARDLLAGRLVAPFDHALTTPARYRVLCPAGHEHRPRLAACLDWTRRAEASASETGLPDGEAACHLRMRHCTRLHPVMAAPADRRARRFSSRGAASTVRPEKPELTGSPP